MVDRQIICREVTTVPLPDTMILRGYLIPPMLCEMLTDPRGLADRHSIAGPQLNGQRAQPTSRREKPVPRSRTPHR